LLVFISNREHSYVIGTVDSKLEVFLFFSCKFKISEVGVRKTKHAGFRINVYSCKYTDVESKLVAD